MLTSTWKCSHFVIVSKETSLIWIHNKQNQHSFWSWLNALNHNNGYWQKYVYKSSPYKQSTAYFFFMTLSFTSAIMKLQRLIAIQWLSYWFPFFSFIFFGEQEINFANITRYPSCRQKITISKIMINWLSEN